MPEPEVSVVIVTFEGRKWLEPCLSAVLAQAGPSFEVILVDNASTDDSAALVREHFPAVRVLSLERNLGFAGGNNAGAALAAGRFLAFLNNDTVVTPGWLKALWETVAAAARATLATSRIVYLDDPLTIDSAGDSYSRSGAAFKRGHGDAAGCWEDAGEVFAACGAAFMIPRDLFAELGGFDEDLFLVYEDVDLSYRAQLLDCPCQYVPAAVVQHAGSATLGTASGQSVFYGQRNLEWIYLKNTPWPLMVRSLPAHLLYLAIAAVYFAGCGRLRPFLAGKMAALRGVAHTWRKRRVVQAQRRTRNDRIWALMDRTSFARKWREKRFDLGLARAR